jgi:outer membrane protein assembly factor BamB
LANGHVVWKTQISQNTSTEGGAVKQFGLIVLNGRVYLTTGSDFWVFDQSTGGVQRMEHFDHYVLSPVAGDRQVFLAGDLHLSSYK